MRGTPDTRKNPLATALQVRVAYDAGTVTPGFRPVLGDLMNDNNGLFYRAAHLRLCLVSFHPTFM